jgi:hypothetical protein
MPRTAEELWEEVLDIISDLSKIAHTPTAILTKSLREAITELQKQ